MKPILYLIRHGQTDWNAMGRLQGQTDIPMNALGKSQVEGNAKKLLDLAADLGEFDFVSSPINRARETMKLIRTSLGLPTDEFQMDDRLKELNYGEFSSHTWEELREARPQDVMDRFDDTWGYVIPSGECYAMLSKRVLNWFHELERDTVVAAHAGVSRVLQGYFAKCPKNYVAFLDAPQDRVLVIQGHEVSWL